MEFKVTPEFVLSAAVNCENTAEKVAAQLAALKSYVLSLEGPWSGVASVTFQNLMNSYDTYSRKLDHALTEIGAGLRANYNNYTTSEEHNVAQLVAIDIPAANL